MAEVLNRTARRISIPTGHVFEPYCTTEIDDRVLTAPDNILVFSGLVRSGRIVIDDLGVAAIPATLTREQLAKMRRSQLEALALENGVEEFRHMKVDELRLTVSEAIFQ